MRPPRLFSTLAFLATCLALPAAPALAQAAERNWRGEALRYTPSSAQGCNVTVVDASLRGGHVVVILRNAGTGTLSFTLSGELAGGNRRSSATATVRLPAQRNGAVTLMQPPPLLVPNSVLTLRGLACSVLG